MVSSVCDWAGPMQHCHKSASEGRKVRRWVHSRRGRRPLQCPLSGAAAATAHLVVALLSSDQKWLLVTRATGSQECCAPTIGPSSWTVGKLPMEVSVDDSHIIRGQGQGWGTHFFFF